MNEISKEGCGRVRDMFVGLDPNITVTCRTVAAASDTAACYWTQFQMN